MFNTREAVTIVVQCGAPRFPAVRHHGGGHDVLHGPHLDEHKRAGVLQRAHQEGVRRGVQDGARLSGQEGTGPREGGPTSTLALALTLTLHCSLDAHSTTAHQPPRPPPRHRCPIGRRRGGTRSLCPSRAARPPRCTLGADRRGSTSTCIAPAPWSEAGGTTRSSPSSIGEPHPTPTLPLPLPLALALAWRHTCATPFCSCACHFLPFTPFLPPCVPRPLPSCHVPLATRRSPPTPPPLRRRTRGTPLPELPAVGQGKSTSSQIGSFWHDKHMYGPDLNNQQLRQRSAYPEPHREPEPQRKPKPQTPTPSPYPNQERHHAPYSDRAPEPVCARGLANRRPDVVSIVSRVDSQCVLPPRPPARG